MGKPSGILGIVGYFNLMKNGVRKSFSIISDRTNLSGDEPFPTL
jgi:hypothetical protein